MLESLSTSDGVGPPTDFVAKDLMSVYAFYNGTAFPVIEGFPTADHWEERKKGVSQSPHQRTSRWLFPRTARD